MVTLTSKLEYISDADANILRRYDFVLTPENLYAAVQDGLSKGAFILAMQQYGESKFQAALSVLNPTPDPFYEDVF